MLFSWRKKEIHLLIYVFIFIMLGLGTIKLINPTIAYAWPPLLIGALTCLAFLATSVFLSFKNARSDNYVLPLVALLTGMGLVMLYRLSPSLAVKQFYWVMIGLVVFVLTTLFFKEYEQLDNYKYLYILAGLVLLVLSIIFGKATNGAYSWIKIGAFSFQPSELVKIFLVLFLAGFLEENKDLLTLTDRRFLGLNIPSLKYLGPLLFVWGLSLALLVLQRDLGTALIFFSTFMAMIYIATSRLSFVFVGMLLFCFGAAASYLLFRHVQVRFQIWLNPWSDMDGKGYQVVQSLFAIGSGGLFGSGLGLGFPKMIPVVESDFIFSAISEEMGLFGGVGIIIVYILLIYRGFKIALTNDNNYGILLASGLTVILTIQAIVILAGVTKLLPLTGITLPFISYGGSSIVANFMLIGLLLNISGKDSGSHES